MVETLVYARAASRRASSQPGPAFANIMVVPTPNMGASYGRGIFPLEPPSAASRHVSRLSSLNGFPR
jgi:hypothetical protein